MRYNIKKPVISYKIVYKIFELTSEGHFREPQISTWGGEEYIFDHYNGYLSLEEAGKAIVRYKREERYSCRSNYVVLPLIGTTQEES